jgi:hypothetical protein
MHEPELAKRVDVPAQRALVLAATFEILGDESGEPAKCHPPQLLDVQRAAYIATTIVASPHFDRSYTLIY